MTPLRILLAGDYAADARLGSSKVYYKLREELARLGHDCDVMLSADIGTWPPPSRLRTTLSPMLAARSIGRVADRYDVIDVASGEGAVLGLRRALTPGARYAMVSRSHGLEHRNYQRLLDDAAAGLLRKSWLRRWWFPLVRLSQVALAARLADRLIVLNADDARFARDRGWKSAGEIDVIPHGVSQRFLNDSPPAGARRGKGVLFCGTWDDVKGVRYLAAAFSKLVEERPSSRLTVLGPSVDADRVLASFAPHARAAVTVLPRVDEIEVMQQYRTHDLLVLPSSYEGFGMVVLEAMSQRLPVVATPVGSALALVRDGETGLRVAPRSPEELAAAMRRMLDDHEVARRVADAAHALALSYTWTRTAEQTVACYERAIAARRRAR